MSGMLNAGFGIGQALGPLVGAFLYELVGFRMTMNITAALTAGSAVLYLLCARGCQAYRETCVNFSNRNRKLSVVEEIVKDAIDIRHSSIFKSSLFSTQKVEKLHKASLIIRSMSVNNQVADQGFLHKSANTMKDRALSGMFTSANPLSVSASVN